MRQTARGGAVMFKDAAGEAAWDLFDPVTCDYDYADAVHHFATGAEWALAGMAVCEFLTDLAELMNMCPECGGSGREFNHPEWDCYVCDGTGNRVTP